MNSLPAKPLPCNQKWDDMIPCGKNGRICLGCGKVVTDFRNFKMKEIVKTHLSSSAPVCGIYTDKQLNNWGQIKGTTHFAKLISISSVFIALSQLFQGEIFSQTKSQHTEAVSNSAKSQKAVKNKIPIKQIRGTVVRFNSDSTKSPIQGASIVLQNDSSFHTTTDSLGRFKINISRKFISLPKTLKLWVSHPDYPAKSLSINKKQLSPLDVILSETLVESKKVELISHGSYFYAMPPVKEKQDTSKNKKWWQKKMK
jgi:hypothetical protein